MKNYRKTSELIDGKSSAHDIQGRVSTWCVITMIVLLIMVINKGNQASDL